MKEFKIVEIPKKEFKNMFGVDFTTVETMLEEKSTEGWEVVSVCPNEYVGNLAGGLLITLQREKNH